MLILAVSACGQVKQATTDSGALQVQNLTDGLDHPWGMAFLPDGRLLVTERSGDLRILDQNNKLSGPVEGVPEVKVNGQGGLLDIVLDPNFAANKYVYLSFAEPGPNSSASTAVGRGVWENDRITGFTTIFSQQPKLNGPNHFGGRIVFSDGNLFLTTGERFQFAPAQDLGNHLGTVVRIKPDGSPADGNPFIGEEGAQPEIWSYGHRNIEAAAIDPATGNLWIAEMGPRGGDELNQPEAGKNYGWPEVSWGENYDGTDIPDPPTQPQYADAVVHWTPVISPSGMAFYSGNMFPAWKGNMLIGGLSAKGVVVVEVNGQQAAEKDRVSLQARIRDVEQAPDGSVYVLTDEGNGKVLRLWK
ncbi:hypothetical protein CRP01_10800 [Flavilitoribacter nigricans DSM 23189 = NBRC 102662]|uniref:Glucose/Sorbosone dehydrogenase domain-containing protein n=2 Tax=Flavilitoribacter TaxID=2762562 RepID=A0A2D0NER4_FLAN2|nr:hypothetical protein CRP01_10800 [Flavilitoribacter nigricans DSM 23189 = NBRC 102662]